MNTEKNLGIRTGGLDDDDNMLDGSMSRVNGPLSFDSARDKVGTEEVGDDGIDVSSESPIRADMETIQKFQRYAAVEYERYKSDREDIDEKNRYADYMYSCAQNRSMMSREQKDKVGMNKDTRSSVGSVLFHRQVNALAAQLVNVIKSQNDLWRYVPVWNEANPLSDQDAKIRADNANALARWIRKKDQFDLKLPEFAVSIFKYSNIPVMIQQRRTYKKVTVVEPVYMPVEDPVTGEVSTTIVEERVRKEVKMVDNYPSITFPHWSMVYADRYIPDMQQQNCVIVLSLVTRADLEAEVRHGWLDRANFKKLKDVHRWDGSEGAEQKKWEAQNRGKEFSPNSNLYLRWDVYARVPVDRNGKWNDDEDERLFWGTFVGNTLDGAVVLAFDECNDPDGEIPIIMVRAMPDSPNELYHTTTAEVIRSLYAADATLLNLAIDNMANANDPPLMIVDGRHRIRDFTFRRGQRWHVDDINAIKQFDIRDVTANTIGLREQVRQDARLALATDPSMMGEFAGARTSATEYLDVARNTRGPQYVQITYILNQLLPWMARKYMSYCEAFMTPSQVVQIVDVDKTYSFKIGDVIGEYDIVIDIVDEYQRHEMMRQEINQIMQTIGSVPYFQQSQSHTTDAGELLRLWLSIYKMPSVSKIILPPTGVDAENAAMARISAMLNVGIYTPPQPGENHAVHLRVAQAERLRWKGLESADDPRVANLPLLDQYIAELKNIIQSGAISAAIGSLQAAMGGAQEASGASPPKGVQTGTETVPGLQMARLLAGRQGG